MIGIIAGEIIGSPYSKENISDMNDIFFPLFETRTVMDPKTYRERTYRPDIGHISNAALMIDDIADLSYINTGDLCEGLAGAVVLGDICAVGRMGSDGKTDLIEQYARHFPDEYRRQLFIAGDAAYRIRTGHGSNIDSLLGIPLEGPRRPEIISALIRGQLKEGQNGTYIPGDGRHDDRYVLEAAFCAVRNSKSYEETVRRATAIGGDSAAVAAIAGGLAELAYGIPDGIADRAKEMLDWRQTEMLKRYEALVRKFTVFDDLDRKILADYVEYMEIPVISIPGKSRIYAVPYGRNDIEKEIKRINKSSIIIRPDGLQKVVERLSVRRDLNGNILSGTYIDSIRPEIRPLYYFNKDGRLYSPTTVPSKDKNKGFPPVNDRVKALSAFQDFARKADEMRREQERRVGHDPDSGHLCFATAWYLQIEPHKVILMKGDTAYGEYGIDSKGRLGVNTNVMGGSHAGEYLEGAMANRRIFYGKEDAREVLAKLSEKCLDDGFVPDPEHPEPSNLELMLRDLANEPELKRAADVTDEMLKDSAAPTRLRMDYASSSEVRTIDEAIDSRAHKGNVFTIGHSNMSIEAFIRNCRRHGITLVRDIRSWPHSKSFPHFDQKALKEELERNGIRYVFNGDTMGGHVRREAFPSEGDGVTFTMSSGGYAQRTRENASAADLTIAFASDFSTAGERVTAEAAKGKIIQIPVSARDCPPAEEIARDIICCMTEKEKSRPLVVNVAGNGISVLSSHGLDQDRINGIVRDVLKGLLDKDVSIRKIISGGQTGADEAGIAAAKALGIPAEVHAPKGWMMRRGDNRDIFSEYEFKSRFAAMPGKDLSYGEMMLTEGFRRTYDEIVDAARKGERQALMCAETNPADCHRFACVGYALEHPSDAGRRYSPTTVQHIRRDGLLISQADLERKICRDCRMEFNENNLAAAMKKAGDSIQHHNPDEHGISLARNRNKGINR